MIPELEEAIPLVTAQAFQELWARGLCWRGGLGLRGPVVGHGGVVVKGVDVGG